MSSKYPGGIISKTAPTPSGAFDTSTAPGVWTLEQQAYWQKLGQWPTAGNTQNFIEDVFSTYLYTGTGANQSIVNGVDLSGKGGLVWIKQRDVAGNHLLMTTDGGPTNRLRSNGQPSYVTSAAGTDLSSFNSNGFSLGVNNQSDINTSAQTYVSWSLRKQPKFFDVVTWTGNGANRTIAHNLGSVPGCIIIGATTALGTNWAVYHRSLANTEYLQLNLTGAKQTSSTYWNSTTATSSVFSLGTNAEVNYNTGTYIAYLFAHDAGGFGLTGTDNVISCGSFTTDGSGNATVSLGYEPQWIMFKSISAGQNWTIGDVLRGWNANSTTNMQTGLRANTSGAENATLNTSAQVTATGFNATQINVSDTFIYIAIRRGPMKVPTSGTSVFSPIAASSGTQTTGFPVDMQILSYRTGTDAFLNHQVIDRLRGISSTSTPQGNYLNTSSTAAESNATPYSSINMTNTGFDVGNNYAGASGIFHSFKRAPSFFDEVCYTGNGGTQTITHNLGVAPELIIGRNRTGSNWSVNFNFASTTQSYAFLNLTDSGGNTTYAGAGVFSTAPTSTSMFLTASGSMNGSGQGIVAYLFATCAGVSKVGSYTGTGAAQTINCGFTSGSRFVMIKRTDSTGDWYVWDSARGIIPANDPYLLLNSTAAEVTGTDYIDTTSVGFDITSTAPSAINANGGTFIFLAIA